MSRHLVVGVVALLALSVVASADAPPPLGDAAASGQELDAIRDELVALDIEKALAALNAILERPELSESTRVEALDLRAQAHVASDDLDAAEKDYHAILELRAGYVPGRDVTSKKAMDRFMRLQASMIGTIHLDVDPKDASLAVEGRPVSISAEGAFQVVAGERILRFTRKGFDTQETSVRAVAGQETLVRIRLVPNARSVVVRTDVDGVAVTLDGVASGVTARAGDAGSDAKAPSVLLIDDVAIGEHDIRLAKACFATESLQEIISVDLADRSPKLLRVVAMRPSRTRVTVTGADYPGELRVDGERVAALPLTSFAMCPGARALEVVASGRAVWSGTVAAEESDLTLDLTPRPNAVLVGTAWPKAWAATVAGWSQRDRVDVPTGSALTTREGWSAVPIPPGTDLAVGVISQGGVGGDERIVLYSPVLQAVEEPPAPLRSMRPVWSDATLGAVLVDGEAGTVICAAVSPDGPAARAGLLPGDRVVAIAGRAAISAAAAKDAVVDAGARATIVLDIAPPSGPARKIECATSTVPQIAPPSGNDASNVVRAAWASVDAAAGGSDAAIALANLASLLDRSGRGAAALTAWRRVRSTGDGILAARAAYSVGAALQADAKSAEATEAFDQARSVGLALGDLALAAAAVDRLADLGVAPR